MTKRSIQEIDNEMNVLSKRRTELYNASLYRDDAGYRWREYQNEVDEINRLCQRIQRLSYERNQARFRDWTEKMNQGKVFKRGKIDEL